MKTIPMGKQALLVEFEKQDTFTPQSAFQKLNSHLEEFQIHQLTPAYDSLLVQFERALSSQRIEEVLKTLREASNQNTPQAPLLKIPVFYDENWDLPELEGHLDLSIDEIIHLHTQSIFEVACLGFLPGFPYLKTLPASLISPRKKTPRKEVPKGAVALAGDQTGIYPTKSPGGWQILGFTPLEIFDLNRADICLFAPGDKVQFQKVSELEFKEIAEEVHQGKWGRKDLL